MLVCGVVGPAGPQNREDGGQELATDGDQGVHLVLAGSGALVEVRTVRRVVADRDHGQEPERAAGIPVAGLGQRRVSRLVRATLDVGWAPAEMRHERLGGSVATGV